MITGAAAQLGSSPAAVGLFIWAISQESLKTALGQGCAAHDSAIYVLKTQIGDLK